MGVAEVMARRAGTLQQSRGYGEPHLHPNDSELVRDIFWDLFRQGSITLGWNDSNDAWPFFRLSHVGGQTLGLKVRSRSMTLDLFSTWSVEKLHHYPRLGCGTRQLINSFSSEESPDGIQGQTRVQL